MKKLYLAIAFLLPVFLAAGQTTGIEAYEYWFDSDYDNRVTGTVPTLTSFTFDEDIPTSGLDDGLHVFHIRFQDKDGQWSSVTSCFFQKLPEVETVEPNDCPIIGYEYWVDSDYAGKSSGPTTATEVFDLETDLDFSGLDDALHVLHIRFEDACGQWSSVSSCFFQKLPEIETAEPNNCPIVGYEYWVDSDYAGKSSVAAGPTEVFNLDEDLNFSGLTDGLHVLHIRFEDACGQWSSVTSCFFQKLPEVETAGPNDCPIVGYEYWIDDQYDENTFVDVAPPEDVLLLSGDLGLSGLDLGQHTFHIRFLDACGQWSSVCSDFFEATACTPDTTHLTLNTCVAPLADPANCTTETFPGSNGCDSVVIICYEWVPDTIIQLELPTCDPALAGQTFVEPPFEIEPGGCWGLEQTTYFLPPNEAPTALSGGDWVCPGENILYSFTDANAVTNIGYLWQIDPPEAGQGGFTDTTFFENAWANPDDQLNFTAMLSVAAINGCGDTSVFSAPLTVGIGLGQDLPICLNDTAQVLVGFGGDCQWDVPSSWLTNDCEALVPGVPESEGLYTVTTEDSFGDELLFCFNTYLLENQEVEISVLPEAPYCQGETLTLEAIAPGATAPTFEWVGFGTENPLETTTGGYFKVRVTDGDRCGVSDTVLVFNENPTVEFTYFGPACEGDTILLEALGGGGSLPYSFGFPNGDFFTEPGEAIVHLTDANGCSASDTAQVEFWDLPQGEIMLSDCMLSFSNEMPSHTYVWTSGGEVVSEEASFSPPANGDYLLEVTDANGCTNLFGPQTVDCVITSMAEPDWLSRLELFPNPADDMVFIELESEWVLQDLHWKLFALSGQQVAEGQYSGTFQHWVQPLETDELSPGIYFLKMELDGNPMVRKLVIGR